MIFSGARLACLVIFCLLIFSIAPPIFAQEDLGRFQKQLEQLHRDQFLSIDQNVPTDRRVLLDYGAYLTFSFLTLDDQENNNHTLRQTELTAYGRLNLDNVQEIFVRGHWGYQDFNKGDSFDGRGSQPIDGDFERAYYRFDLRRALEAYKGKDTDGDFIFEAGRDLVYWGNGLTLSETIDGIIARLESPVADVDVIAGVTPVRTVDIDTTRPNFDHNTRRGFYGIQVSKQIGKNRPFFYALMQRDYNRDFELNFTSPTIQTRFHYNSYYLGLGSQGSISDRLLYGVEAVYEGGFDLSNSFQQPPDGGAINGVQQTDDAIHAFAGDIRFDYLLGDSHQTRFSLEGIVSSGDPDRFNSTTDTFGGNRPGTGDNAFNAYGFVNTGVAFAPPVSNLMALRIGASTLPFSSIKMFDRLQLGADFFVFGKSRMTAPIDEPTADDHRFLGWEPDVFINWQVTNDVTLALRYGIFFPGQAIDNNQQNRQFFFAGVTYAF